MAVITNIQFRDNPPQSAGQDYLRITLKFDDSELNSPFLLKVKYRRVGPGAHQEEWNNLLTHEIVPKHHEEILDFKPNIYANTGFQQNVKFKVSLMASVTEEESTLFPIRL